MLSPALPWRREFSADSELVEEFPLSDLAGEDRDFGWMLHDIDNANDRASAFYRARMESGVIDVKKCLAERRSAWRFCKNSPASMTTAG